MIAIRLARLGRKKGPFYRVVAIDSRKKVNGEFLDILGFWNPAKDTKKIDSDKIKVWVEKGAQISPAVKKLIG